MSYHGLGQVLQPGGFPQPIQKAPDTIEQPSGDIKPMTMVNYNPMLEPAGVQEGDQAMMLEMQARTGIIQPIEDPAVFQQPEVKPSLTKPYYEPVPSGEASTVQPVESIITEGPPVIALMPTHPVVGLSKPMGPITMFVPETGLDPAQLSKSVDPGPQCPEGQKAFIENGKTHCIPQTYQPEGPITKQAAPPAGPIPPGTPPAGPITNGYVYQPPPVVSVKKKSPVVPIAIAAGAAILLSRLL